MYIQVRNTLDTTAQSTFLSNAEGVGTASLRVKNINAFQASWAVQVGKTGEEQSEIVLLGTATPSGTALSLSGTTLYEHPADTPVYAIKFDKVIFKRSTAGTAGTATAITNGTITITPDSDYTQFDDTNGASSYAYRAVFYNSVTTEESAESDWLTPSGPSFYSLQKIRERIKRKLFSSHYIKDDDTINDWINEWLELLTNEAIDVDKDYLLGTAAYAFGTSGLGTITASDFKELKRFWVTYNGVDTFRAAKISPNGFYPNETFSDSHPYYYFQGDTVFGVKPEKDGGTANIIYYQMMTPLDSDGDEIPKSMQAYTKSFVDYGVAQAYYNDMKEDLGDRYMAMANAAKEDFKTQITPRSKTGPQVITLLEAVDADDTRWEIR